MKACRLLRPLTLSLALTGLCLASAAAAGENYAVFGADTTSAQREAMARIAALDVTAKVDSVNTAEVVEALQNTGASVTADDKSIASSVVTCLNPGEGVSVRTENIARVTPSAYAGALAVAGARAVRVLILAPPDEPVTGETALVGVVKALPQCKNGKPLDPARVRLAYKQIAWTAALAGATGDVDRVAGMLLEAEASVASLQSPDVPTVSSALDRAAATENVPVDPPLRPFLVDYLLAFEHLDLGGAGGSFSGAVERTGQPLTVRVNGQDRTVSAAAYAAVTRDGRATSLAGLRKGDRVTVALNLDGTAQRIEATRVGIAVPAWLRWLIPPLALLVLLGLVALLMLRGRDNDFILEPDAPGILPPRGP